MSRFFCRFGLHSWDKWELWMIDAIDHQPREYRRNCSCCGKRQKGIVEIKIKTQDFEF